LQKLLESYNKRNNFRANFLKQKQDFIKPKRGQPTGNDEDESGEEEVLSDESGELVGVNGRVQRDEEMKRLIRNHLMRFRNGKVGRSANNPELRKLLMLG
jgi:hypothetical protein